MDEDQRLEKLADTMSPEKVLSLLKDNRSLRNENKQLKGRYIGCERRLKAARKEIKRNSDLVSLRNAQLNTMSWVWCSGGCYGELLGKNGPLTKEDIRRMEGNVSRIKTYFFNYLLRTHQREVFVEAKGYLCDEPHNPVAVKAAENIANDWWERHICKPS